MSSSGETRNKEIEKKAKAQAKRERKLERRQSKEQTATTENKRSQNHVGSNP